MPWVSYCPLGSVRSGGRSFGVVVRRLNLGQIKEERLEKVMSLKCLQTVSTPGAAGQQSLKYSGVGK